MPLQGHFSQPPSPQLHSLILIHTLMMPKMPAEGDIDAPDSLGGEFVFSTTFCTRGLPAWGLSLGFLPSYEIFPFAISFHAQSLAKCCGEPQVKHIHFLLQNICAFPFLLEDHLHPFCHRPAQLLRIAPPEFVGFSLDEGGRTLCINCSNSTNKDL